jgi:hypothetical protein
MKNIGNNPERKKYSESLEMFIIQGDYMNNQWESIKTKAGEISEKAKPIAKSAVELAKEGVEKIGDINQDAIKAKVGEMKEKARPIAKNAVELAIGGVDKVDEGLEKMARKLDKK